MTSDSNPASHPPPEKDAPRPEPEAVSDESIDLGDLQSVEEDASALSFSGRSGSRSGGSSSGIRSWEQLVRETAPESDVDAVTYDQVSRPTGISPEDDLDSDKDLLRQVLADEPRPSSIILKDPSLGEAPALRVPANDAAAAPFALPPDLAATRPDDSSILSPGPMDSSHSGITSDVFGSSSRVDLLRADQSSGLSSGSLQRTDEMSDPPRIAPPSGESSFTNLGAGPAGDAPGGSAVDLGRHGAVDLPFPLGLDSTVGSRIGPGRNPNAPASNGNPDSGTVDLLASGDEFDLGMIEPAASPSWAAAREDLPPTVPMVPAGKARLLAIAGGGTGGLLAGVALCVGLWFAGLVPNQSAKSTPALAPSTPSPDLGDWPAKVQAMTTQRDEETRKAAAATADAQKALNQVAKLNADLTEAKATAAEAAKAGDRTKALSAQLKQAEAAQAGLKESVAQLTAGKATADAKLREEDASLTALRARLASANAEASEAKEKATAAESTAKQSAAFAADLAHRLQIAPTAPPAEVLAALDRALAQPATEPATVYPSRSSAAPVRTAEQIRQAVWTGVNSYRAGNFAAAESEFARLASFPAATAIHWYYLGLAQWRQGRLADAETSFRRGWVLERASRPPPGEVEAAFERLDRADRDAVNHFRR